ncbi:hypothetical protein MRX96_043747 [Rhipicephalus microplus]
METRCSWATSCCILQLRQSSFNEILAPKTSGVCMMIFAGTPLPTSSLSCLMPFPSVDASPLRRTTLTSQQHYIRPDKTSPASSGLGSMSATPHAHAIRLPFVQSLTLMCLLTSFNEPPCVANGDTIFVGHQLLHLSTTTVFVQRDPGSENERSVHDDLRRHTPAYVIAQLPHALSFCRCFTATSTTLTSQQHYIRPDKTSPASSGLGSMSATPHAHAIRLPFVQSLTLMCLLTSLNEPPCVADGEPDVRGPPAAASFNYDSLRSTRSWLRKRAECA